MAFVVIAYAISWAIWLTGILSIDGLTSIEDERFAGFLLAGSFGPTVAALVMAGFTAGRSSIVSLLKRLILVRVNWRVYVVTLFLMPVIGLVFYLVLGISAKIALWKIATTMVALVPLNALLGGVIFGFGPLGEEMGWRGFLQSHLQGRVNSVTTAIIVGLVWAFWHLPAFRFADFRNGLDWSQFVVLYPISTILLAFIMGHLWRWSNGSLFIAIFFHAVLNTTAVNLTRDNWWDFGDLTAVQIYLSILAIFALTACATELLSRTVLRQSEPE
ncbi:MAG: CPBP family intramembrane metalloprotease [Candidatus Eisenbacteria bacterium]|nr:CPBP family intramembrane metalloprotease [Candidatus Eisenbacteria bacterium]